MADKKTLTFGFMDAPFESARTATVLRIIDIAVRRGHNVNVFAYEGAVALPFALQQQHPNVVHGRNAEEENHLLPRELIAGLMEQAEANSAKLDWMNCRLCVEERGVYEAIDGVRTGSPPDFWKMVEASDNALVIGTRE